MPDFVRSHEFLAACKARLAEGGKVAFNYIIPGDEDWQATKRVFGNVFPDHRIISNEINRIFIGS